MIDPDFNITFYTIQLKLHIRLMYMITWILTHKFISIKYWYHEIQFEFQPFQVDKSWPPKIKNPGYTFSSSQLSVLPKMLQMLKKENKIKWNRFCICFYSLRHCPMMIIWVVKPTIVVKICICLHLLKSFLFLLFLKSTL